MNQESTLKLNPVVVLSLFFVLNSLISLAQTFPYIHYTTKDGLSNNTVLSMVQDSDGYMWFGTTNGLSKFDGYSFQNFYKKDGMNSNIILSLSIGQSNALWVCNGEAGFCKRPDKYSAAFEKMRFTGPGVYNLDIIKIIGDTLVSINPYGGLGIFDLRRNIGVSFFSIFSPQTNTPFCLIYTSKMNLLIGSSSGLWKLTNGSFFRFRIKGLANSDSTDSPIYSLYEGTEGVIYAGGIGRIFKIKNNEVIGEIRTPDPDLPVNRLLVDRFDNIWFYTLGGNDFYLLRSGRSIPMKERIGLDKCVINGIISDSEGNVWVSVFGKGIYYFYNSFIENFTSADELESSTITCINKSSAENVLVGTYDGLFVYSDYKFSHLSFIKKNLEYIKYIKNGSQNRLYICGINVASEMSFQSFPKQFKVANQRMPLDVYFFHFNTVEETGDSIVAGGWGNELSFAHLKDNKIIIGSKMNIYADPMNKSYVRVNKILSHEGDLWVATSGGLFMIRVNGARESSSIFADIPVSQIIKDKDGKIWVVSEDKLGYYYNGKWTIISHVGNYPLSHLLALTFDNRKRMWVSTNEGLIMADGEKARLFNQSDGLPSNEISDLYYDETKNAMWVGTTDGLSRIDLTILDKQTRTKANVTLMAATTNDSLLKSSSITLPYSQSDLQLNYHLNSLNGHNLFTLQYNFDQQGWQTMEAPELKFSAMRRGKHSIAMRAMNRYGESGQFSQLSFTVAPPFYGTWYFITATVLVFLGGVWRVVKWRMDRTRAKAAQLVQLNSEINSLQHQMLAAQMNPHFIFNSLNSFQYFINTDQKEKANNYLVRLAKLIRMNLDNAEQSFIPIRAAYQRMQLYLELEQIRFEEKIDFSIEVDPAIDPNRTHVPNFIAQPFVENAIWHGLQHVKDKKIKISGMKSGENIIIKIIDNGIGVKAAEKNKKPDHISKGIHIVRERLRLLSGLNGQANGLIEIIDNSEESESVRKGESEEIGKDTAIHSSEFVTGTSVTITLLPQMYLIK